MKKTSLYVIGLLLGAAAATELETEMHEVTEFSDEFLAQGEYIKTSEAI